MVSTAAFHARVRGSVPGLGGLKETKMFLPHPCVKVSIVGILQSSHHLQEVLLAQFSLYVHKGGIKPDSFHLQHCLMGVSAWVTGSKLQLNPNKT